MWFFPYCNTCCVCIYSCDWAPAVMVIPAGGSVTVPSSGWCTSSSDCSSFGDHTYSHCCAVIDVCPLSIAVSGEVDRYTPHRWNNLAGASWYPLTAETNCPTLFVDVCHYGGVTQDYHIVPLQILLESLDVPNMMLLFVARWSFLEWTLLPDELSNLFGTCQENRSNSGGGTLSEVRWKRLCFNSHQSRSSQTDGTQNIVSAVS